MASPDVYLYASRWLRMAVLLSFALFAAAAVYGWRRSGLTPLSALVMVMTIVSALGAIDVFALRIALDDRALVVRSLFRRRSYPRASIEQVKSEGGGVVLKIDGAWVQLPDLGRNSLSVRNTIAGWLKRG